MQSYQFPQQFEKVIVHILMLSVHDNVVDEFRDFLVSFYFVFQKHVICENVHFIYYLKKYEWVTQKKKKKAPFFLTSLAIKHQYVYIFIYMWCKLGCQENIKMSLPSWANSSLSLYTQLPFSSHTRPSECLSPYFWHFSLFNSAKWTDNLAYPPTLPSENG